jgi:hypothetical protein
MADAQPNRKRSNPVRVSLEWLTSQDRSPAEVSAQQCPVAVQAEGARLAASEFGAVA